MLNTESNICHIIPKNVPLAYPPKEKPLWLCRAKKIQCIIWYIYKSDGPQEAQLKSSEQYQDNCLIYKYKMVYGSWYRIAGYLTLHEAYGFCVGNHTGHNLHTMMRWHEDEEPAQPGFEPSTTQSMEEPCYQLSWRGWPSCLQGRYWKVWITTRRRLGE